MSDEGQLILRRKLLEYWEERRAQNPKFSLRAFSQKLGITSASLSEFLNGRRRFSPKLAERLFERLELDPTEKKTLLQKVEEFRRTEKQKFTHLQADHFAAIADWQHFAILSLAETADFKSEPSWIAHRLGLEPLQCREALDRLLRLGMLEEKSDGSLKCSGAAYASPDEIADAAVRKSHIEDLNLLRDSLENDVVGSRDFSSMTMAIDPRKLPQAKKMIRKFMISLSSMLESGSKKEVYKISTGLIPLSRERQERP